MTMQPLWISRSLVQDCQVHPQIVNAYKKDTENQYENNNVILMIVDFKDSDPALATHDFDVIG